MNAARTMLARAVGRVSGPLGLVAAALVVRGAAEPSTSLAVGLVLAGGFGTVIGGLAAVPSGLDSPRPLLRALATGFVAGVLGLLTIHGAVVSVRGGLLGVIASVSVALVLGAIVRTARRRPPHRAVGRLPMPELCRQWRHSCGYLHGVRDPAELEVVALIRRQYLDEFERRDPHGFAAWRAADTCGSVDPGLYLREPR